MLKAFFLLLMTSYIYANTIVDIYLDSGIGAVEKYIQTQLESKSYWADRLKEKDVSLGYYEKLDTLLVANKKTKKLEVFNNADTKLTHVTTYDVIVGKNGDKKEEGDLKTPLGVYEITKRFTPSDQFYGPLAYVLSYPNTKDKVEGKNGYGIWIHGSPLDGSERDPMSKGCIVMDNDTINLLDTNLKSDSAITLVGEDEIQKTTTEEISIILANLYRWKNVWEVNNLTEYLAFYSDDFKRYNGMGKKAFSKMKQYVFANDSDKTIKLENINISPYPNEENKKIFKIAFYEYYNAKRHKYQGNKELYVLLENDKFSILVEK